MLLERCRKCGNMPEILYRAGYTYKIKGAARAQIKCFACGNAARPVWGDSEKESLIYEAAGYWNKEQRQFNK